MRRTKKRGWRVYHVNPFSFRLYDKQRATAITLEGNSMTLDTIARAHKHVNNGTGTGVPVWAYGETVTRFYPVPRVGRTLHVFILFLARFDSWSGEMFPTIRFISKETGLGFNTVRRMIALAEQLNIFTVEPLKRERRRVRNCYQFTDTFRQNLRAIMEKEFDSKWSQRRSQMESNLKPCTIELNSSKTKERAFSFRYRKKRPLKLAE